MVGRHDPSFSKQTEEMMLRSPIRTFPAFSNFLILFLLSHLSGRYAEPAYRPARFELAEYGRNNPELGRSTNAEEHFQLEGNYHQGTSSVSSSDPRASAWPSNERIAASDNSHGSYDPYHSGSHAVQQYNEQGTQFLSLRQPETSSTDSFNGVYLSPARTNPEIYPEDAYSLSTHHLDGPSEHNPPSMTTSGSMPHDDQNIYPRLELVAVVDDWSHGHSAHHVLGPGLGDAQTHYGNLPDYIPGQEDEYGYHSDNSGSSHMNSPGYSSGEGTSDAQLSYEDTLDYNHEEGDKKLDLLEYYFDFSKNGVKLRLKLAAEPSQQFMEFMKRCVDSKACFDPVFIIPDLQAHYALDWGLPDQKEIAGLKVAKAEVALQLLQDEGEKAIQDMNPVHSPGNSRLSQRLKEADSSTCISSLPWPAREISTIVMGMGSILNEHSGTAKLDQVQYLRGLNQFLDKFWQDFHFDQGEITYTGDHKTFLRQKGIHTCVLNAKLLTLILTLQDSNLTTRQVIYYRAWSIFTAWISSNNFNLWKNIFENQESQRKKKESYGDTFMDFFYSVLFEKHRVGRK